MEVTVFVWLLYLSPRTLTLQDLLRVTTKANTHCVRWPSMHHRVLRNTMGFSRFADQPGWAAL